MDTGKGLNEQNEIWVISSLDSKFWFCCEFPRGAGDPGGGGPVACRLGARLIIDFSIDFFVVSKAMASPGCPGTCFEGFGARPVVLVLVVRCLGLVTYPEVRLP